MAGEVVLASDSFDGALAGVSISGRTNDNLLGGADEVTWEYVEGGNNVLTYNEDAIRYTQPNGLFRRVRLTRTQTADQQGVKLIIPNIDGDSLYSLLLRDNTANSYQCKVIIKPDNYLDFGVSAGGGVTVQLDEMPVIAAGESGSIEMWLEDLPTTGIRCHLVWAGVHYTQDLLVGEVSNIDNVRYAPSIWEQGFQQRGQAPAVGEVHTIDGVVLSDYTEFTEPGSGGGDGGHLAAKANDDAHYFGMAGA